jgi:hypothetical protein
LRFFWQKLRGNFGNIGFTHDWDRWTTSMVEVTDGSDRLQRLAVLANREPKTLAGRIGLKFSTHRD